MEAKFPWRLSESAQFVPVYRCVWYGSITLENNQGLSFYFTPIVIPDSPSDDYIFGRLLIIARFSTRRKSLSKHSITRRSRSRNTPTSTLIGLLASGKVREIYSPKVPLSLEHLKWNDYPLTRCIVSHVLIVLPITNMELMLFGI